MKKFKTILLLIVTFSGVLAQEQTQEQVQEQGRTLEEVTVEAEVEGNYAEKNSSAAMKSKMPLLNTPQSISVINRKQIDDMGARNASEILNYVSGVKIDGTSPNVDSLTIRGFPAEASGYKDGLSIDSAIHPSLVPHEELYGIERVELMKGPVAALYGKTPLGGMLHYQSKRPVAKDFAEIRLGTDNYGSFEQGADVGFTNQNKNLYFRLIALNRNQKSFTNLVEGGRQYIAPSLTWDITSNTKFTLLLNYQGNRFTNSMGLPMKGSLRENPNGQVPISTYLGNEDVNQVTSKNAQITSLFEHSFSIPIILRQSFRYQKIYGSEDDNFSAKKLEKDNKTLFMYHKDNFQNINMYHADTGVDYKFETFDVNHTLTSGIDLMYMDIKRERREGSCKEGEVEFCAKVNIYRPQEADFPTNKNPWSNPDSETSQSMGVYIQENAEFAGFTLSLAGRYDLFRDINKKEKEISSGAFSPRAGLSYEFIKGFSTFANYSESFENQGTKKDKNGKSFGPKKGINFEFGFKTNAFNEKLVSNLVFYQLTKKNIAEEVEDTDYYEVIGGQRSRGIEFDASLDLFSGLVSTFAYSFTDTKFLDGKKKGKSRRRAPRHIVSTWIKYTFNSTFLKDLGLGIGARYLTSQYGDKKNTFTFPGYEVLDASISYIFNNLKGQINFNNITNKSYTQNVRKELLTIPGEPFNVRASVTASF